MVSSLPESKIPSQQIDSDPSVATTNQDDDPFYIDLTLRRSEVTFLLFQVHPNGSHVLSKSVIFLTFLADCIIFFKYVFVRLFSYYPQGGHGNNSPHF